MSGSKQAFPKAKTNGLTYADAGVDITAGNDLVTAIKPLAKSVLFFCEGPNVGRHC